MMNPRLTCAAACLVLAGVLGGCASDTFPAAPTKVAFVLPTLVPSTQVPPTPTATATPTPLPATATPAGATRGPTPRASPVTVPSTVSPTRATSPTAAVAPGLYVTDLRTDPPPARGSDLKFLATFLNSTGKEQSYRWEVFIFRADTQKSFGETSKTDSVMPAGSIERQSNGMWKLQGGGACDFFYAQVGWFNSENKLLWFNAPNGSVFQKPFTVCPP